MNELFQIEESLSPRLAWIKEHQIRTHHQPSMEEEESPWTAWLPMHDWDETQSGCFSDEFENDVGYGRTKDEAMADLCIKCGFTHWSEPKPESCPECQGKGFELHNEVETECGNCTQP